MQQKNFDSQMIQMFAINDIPDVVQASSGLTNPQLAGSVEAGVFMPLNELLEQYGQDLLKKVPKEAWDKETDAKGNIYAIPEWLSNPSRRATWIRADLLEQTGLPEPKTVDDFLNVMRAFKKMGVENPYMGSGGLCIFGYVLRILRYLCQFLYETRGSNCPEIYEYRKYAKDDPNVQDNVRRRTDKQRVRHN